jgi:peptidoglycan/xylan/chitin deacetylase (PgdA/CDA1 family)
MREDTLILCYHAISKDWPADLSVSPSAFEEQIRRKLRNGYRGTTLTQSRLPDRPAKTLVVTFDDGYLSTLAIAAPILKRLGVPGTLFVPSDYMGRAGPMTWPGIEMWATGPPGVS